MSVNADVFFYINHNLQNPLFDAVLPVITHFGGFIWFVIIFIAVIIYARMKQNDTLKNVAVIALVSLLFADIITYVLKMIVQEPRPYAVLSNVRVLVYEDDIFAFPSGHATSTFAVVTSLILNIRKLCANHYNIAVALLMTFAVVIAFSRVYCGVHYPLDVLAGMAVGITGALVVNRLRKDVKS